MLVKKIIAKNFIVPGIQTYLFDNLNGLIGGGYFSVNELDSMQNLLNGAWKENTLSFESFYPKFSGQTSEMDLELDVLIEFSDEELETFNKIVTSNGYRPQKSKVWYYTIKAFFPFIFPVVNLRSADDKKDNSFMLGTHLDKFVKSNLSKKDILTALGVNAVARFRTTYFKYKNLKGPLSKEEKFEEYLQLIRSTFRYDVDFIKNIGKLVFLIDDGDILNYGDQFDFFAENESIKKWVNNIEILRDNDVFKIDFLRLLYNNYFVDLQWVYSARSVTTLIEPKQIFLDNFGTTLLNSRELDKLLKVEVFKEPLEYKELTKIETELKTVKKDDIKFNFNLEKDLEEIYKKYEKLKEESRIFEAKVAKSASLGGQNNKNEIESIRDKKEKLLMQINPKIKLKDLKTMSIDQIDIMIIEQTSAKAEELAEKKAKEEKLKEIEIKKQKLLEFMQKESKNLAKNKLASSKVKKQEIETKDANNSW